MLPWDRTIPSGFSKLDASLNAELLNAMLVNIWARLERHPGSSSAQLAEHMGVFDQCEIDMFIHTHMTKWASYDAGCYFATPLREIDAMFF